MRGSIDPVARTRRVALHRLHVTIGRVSRSGGAFPDPRTFEQNTDAEQGHWYELARVSLQAGTARVRDDADAALVDALRLALVEDAAKVEAAVERAPSPFVARHLWRIVDRVWRAPEHDGAESIVPFAMPVVVVAGATGEMETHVCAVLPDVQALVDCMRQGQALRGNHMLGFGHGLVSASALSISALARWRSLRAPGTNVAEAMAAALAPADIPIRHGEFVHLRFLPGWAIAPRSVDLFADRSVGKWAAGATQELVRMLHCAHASVLALPRAPQTPLAARHDGLTAQREVSAQLFASNAIRTVRASRGEPVAVISGHRAADAPGGGELRLSISSPLEPRDAQGFRCPIQPIEPVSAPLSMLLDLLHDCRVTEVHLVAGVHPERGPRGMPLFFNRDTIPEGALLQ